MEMWTMLALGLHGGLPDPVVRNCSDTHGVGASRQLARIPTK